jgi:hypothetical protein
MLQQLLGELSAFILFVAWLLWGNWRGGQQRSGLTDERSGCVEHKILVRRRRRLEAKIDQLPRQGRGK